MHKCDWIYKSCLMQAIINIQKSHFKILNSVSLVEKARCLIYAILSSVQLQLHQIFQLLLLLIHCSLLAELSTILDGFFTSTTQVITYVVVVGQVWWVTTKLQGNTHLYVVTLVLYIDQLVLEIAKKVVKSVYT